MGARDTRTIATSPYSSDGPSDINSLLLLEPTIATDSLTLEDHCYYRGTWHKRGY
jgi:hypothetical protein